MKKLIYFLLILLVAAQFAAAQSIAQKRAERMKTRNESVVSRQLVARNEREKLRGFRQTE
jgi:hypothetical protein